MLSAFLHVTKTLLTKIGKIVLQSFLHIFNFPIIIRSYINDLPAVPNLCSLKSYVDDSQLYLSFPVQETAMAVEHLSEDLQRIAAWCCTHSMLINPDKTKGLFTWSGGPRSSGVGFFCFHALGDTKQKKPTH